MSKTKDAGYYIMEIEEERILFDPSSFLIFDVDHSGGPCRYNVLVNSGVLDQPEPNECRIIQFLCEECIRFIFRLAIEKPRTIKLLSRFALARNKIVVHRI